MFPADCVHAFPAFLCRVFYDYRAGLQGSGYFQLWPDEAFCQNPSADFTGADSKSKLSEKQTHAAVGPACISEGASRNLRVVLEGPFCSPLLNRFVLRYESSVEDLSSVLSSICLNSESAGKAEFLCALMLSD